jgi:hypothetical protein
MNAKLTSTVSFTCASSYAHLRCLPHQLAYDTRYFNNAAAQQRRS